MRTAKEYIEEYGYYDGDQFGVKEVSEIINKARKEAIEECAKSAFAVNNSSTALAQSLSGQTTLSQMINQRGCYVDKQSILSLINKLK